MKKELVTYMVTYQDDNRQKHITFVKGYSQVRFIEERFGSIIFEALEKRKDR